MPAKLLVAAAAVVAAAAFAPTAKAATTPEPLFGSLDEFSAAWNATAAQLESVDPSLDQFEVNRAAFAVAPLPQTDPLGAADVFSAPIHTNGFVGGLVDPATGSVLAAVVGGDPDASVIRGAVGILILAAADPSAPGLTEMGQAWADFADNYKTVPSAYAVAGELGLFMQTFPGAEPDDETISIVAAPVRDEMTAFSQAYSLTLAVGLQALESPAATTSGPSTQPVAPASTALPTPSLAPSLPAPSVPTPGVTAVPPTTVAGPPMTTATPVQGALFASIDDLIARWNAETALTPVRPGVDLTISSAETALNVGAGPGGTDVFATWIGESAVIGGLADPESSTVQQLVILVAPGGAVSSEVIVTSVDLAAPDAFAEYMTAYTDLLGAAPGTTRYVVSGDRDVVLTTTTGFADSAVIAISVAPVTDEATATANATASLDPVLQTASLAASG